MTLSLECSDSLGFRIVGFVIFREAPQKRLQRGKIIIKVVVMQFFEAAHCYSCDVRA